MIKNVKANVDEFSKVLGVSNIIAKLLINRGLSIKESREFLQCELNNLKDGMLLKDMDKSVNIIEDAIKNRDKVLIVGDYDVDGVISSYILYEALNECGANVSYHIPHRINEGYGINIDIIERASESGVDVIITCDNGIAALDQIKRAKELGMKVIVTDHHDIAFIERDGEREYVLPEADAVVNPKRLDCTYPFEKLCGAGVAFKLITCLFKRLNKKDYNKFIEFVAIATVCDVVDLIGENRIIVKEGLKMINNSTNKGLVALKRITGIEDKDISAYHLGFIIGPCINATGRLETAEMSLKLLLSKNDEEAKQMAEVLFNLNKERQEMTSEGVEKAISEIEKNRGNEKVLVTYLEGVHESIAGIIAGRVREAYNLPTIILTNAHEGAKGSARSIEGYNMFEELLKCKDILTKFGGHPMAAGMSLPIDKIDEFREKLNKENKLTDDDVIPKVSIDMLMPVDKISFGLIDEIGNLEPYGKANPKPMFGATGIMIRSAKILGKDKNVLKLRMNYGNIWIDGIYFGDNKNFEDMIIRSYGIDEYDKLINGLNGSIKIDIIYYPDINEYMGNKSLQLIIQNYRVSK